MAANLRFTTSRPEGTRNVTTVRMDGIRAGWEQWFLLSSDRHWDNPMSDRKLQKEHLEEALERRAGILDFGDLFCAMQGKYDPRASKKDIRPEHNTSDYLDSLVRTAGDWFAPYARNIVVIGDGNHETSILKRHETNLTQRLIERLNTSTGATILHGGFSGFVRFMFQASSTRSSKVLAYHHGYGGDAPVTKGTIQTNRMSVYLPDADFVVTGHTHNAWLFPINRIRLSDLGHTYHDEQLHIKTPGYKEEFQDGMGGWHVERGAPPKPIGAAWLRFYLKGGEIKSEVRLTGS